MHLKLIFEIKLNHFKLNLTISKIIVSNQIFIKFNSSKLKLFCLITFTVDMT